MYPKYFSTKGFTLLFILIFPALSFAQAVTGIITDLDGYWKSTESSINPAKPNKSHNLLAFSYNGFQYSTGVNNELLSSKGENFVPCDFWALPVASISGTINGNTKIGLGELYDGVSNGASNPAPNNSVPFYLTDGIKGLDLGTCVANLPSGTMDFFASSIDPASIGDGIPDILVTQVADPSGSYDRYEFIDNNGVRVGNYKDIVFTSINPVGDWTADFYQAGQSPTTLSQGFTKTDRPMRLWAADLSEFGLTASNIASVSKFRINLSGNSDVAFVAYNHKSFRVAIILPLKIKSFYGKVPENRYTLYWEAAMQGVQGEFIVERSTDAKTYTYIGKHKVAESTNMYSFVDPSVVSGTYYYRLRLVDENKNITYSPVIKLSAASTLSLQVKASNNSITVMHESASGKERIFVLDAMGSVMQERHVAPNAGQTSIYFKGQASGIYFIVWTNGQEKSVKKIIL